jgi:Tfp pilus assembly protein PilF
MHARRGWWMVGLSLAAAVGCHTLAPKKTSDPVVTLLQPADGDPEPPAKDLPPNEGARVCMSTADEFAKNINTEVQAIALYEKARQTDPKCPVSHRLAVLYDRQGDFQKAQEEYRKALKHDPHDADLLNNMGYGYYSRGRWAEAEQYLRQALSVKPKHPEATMNLALCVGALGRYAEALELFEKVVTPAQARCNLAFVLTTQHKWPEAERAYREALQLDPDIPLARAALAKLEKAQQQPSAPEAKTAQTPAKPEGIAGAGFVQSDAADKSAVRQAAHWTSAPTAHP